MILWKTFLIKYKWTGQDVSNILDLAVSIQKIYYFISYMLLNRQLNQSLLVCRLLVTFCFIIYVS